MKMTIILALAILPGCAHESIINRGPNGYYTQITKTSFLNRSHIQAQSQTGTTTPIAPVASAVLPDTHSNKTGFEKNITNFIAPRAYRYSPGQDANASNPNASFFYYESQSDPEPGVRAIRIGTVGAVTAYGIGSVR